jgi:hypothetical protein
MKAITTKHYELLSDAAAVIPENKLVQDIIQIVEQTIFDEQLTEKGETDTLDISNILAINNTIRKDSDQNQALEVQPIVVDSINEQESPDPEKSMYPTIVSLSESVAPETSEASPELENSGIVIFTSAVSPFNFVEIPERVMFMVQILASPKKPGPGFFHKIQENMPDQKILHYKDMDQLDKYTVGVFTDLNQAMDTLRVLRKLSYDTYIIAFIDGKKG